MGLPRSFRLPGLSRSAAIRAVGNGVPVPMARLIARAIRDRRQPGHGVPCPCGCGRVLAGKQRLASDACRQRVSRARRYGRAADRDAVRGEGDH